jgi:hypothetical protein
MLTLVRPTPALAGISIIVRDIRRVPLLLGEIKAQLLFHDIQRIGAEPQKKFFGRKSG